MSRKFGKKNVIKVDPLNYNLGLLGEGGIGKSTLAKEVCEKLVGVDGYIIANCGREDGIDAIAGAMYEDIPDWDVFEEFCDDIIESKMTDYKDLKVVVWDTIGELIRISEPEAIRLYNKEQQGKKGGKNAKTINQAWGGFGKGEEYVINLIMGKMWELKRAGVAMFLIGHTKKRTKSDVMSGTDYDTITTDLQYNYFNPLRTKLHILGIASIDREIITEKTGKKDFSGKEIQKGKIVGESRKIVFRDDNYNVESKSRFAQIVDSIPFNPDEFIKAIEDAIKAEFDKEGNLKPLDDVKVEQAKKKEEQNEKVNKELKNSKALETAIEKVNNFLKENKGSMDTMKPILLKLKELGLKSPNEVSELKDALELLRLTK